MPLLEIRQVSKSYATPGAVARTTGGSSRERVQALRSVTIDLRQGEAHGVVGESGAGKTTLAAVITGLEQPTSGEVRIGGTTLAEGDRKSWARKVQLVWQDPAAALDPRQRIGAAIAEPLMIQGASREDAFARALELMQEVDLDSSLQGRFPGEISGGQAQRVVIARALAVDPSVVILDEPASALDAPVKMLIGRMLKRLGQERGFSYLVIAHDLPLVRRLTDTVSVMYRGAVVEQGPTSPVLEDPLHPYTRMLVASDPAMLTAAEWPGEVVFEESSVAGTDSGICPFLGRCAMATGRCREEEVALAVVGDRKVACLESVT